MNKERILGLIRHPETLSYEADLPLVKELIEAFPFYAAPHALMARLHYDQKSIYFDKHLRLSAGYIGSRERLYELLHGKPGEAAALAEKGTPALATPVEQETHEPEKPAHTLQPGSLTDNPVPEQEVLLEKEKSDAADIREPETTGERTSDTNAPTPEDQNAEKQSHKDMNKTENSLEIPGFASYDYFAYYEKVLKKTDEQSGRPTLQLSVSGEEKEQKSQPVSIPDYSLPAGEEALPDTKKYSFSAWLDRLKTPGLEIKPPPGKPKQEDTSRDSKPDKNAKPSYNTVPVDEIISNFIAQEPRIKPKATKFFSPEDMARQSAGQDLSLATETLAEIYLKQGLTEKAIEIYRELSARYPLKSSYFAAKIREVKHQ